MITQAKPVREVWAGITFPALVAVVGMYVLWILSLPCFPSTDGPVHMYYAHILGTLLTHSNAQYARFFHVRHLLPPYSLYYYLLLGMAGIFPMFVADRLVICLYFISFVFGLRFMMRALGRHADLCALMATPLLLNWSLGMGFVNFCLSLALSFWALGVWLRVMGSDRLLWRAAFPVLATLVMLAHPIPLLLTLAIAGLLLCGRFLNARLRAGRWCVPEKGWADLLTLGTCMGDVAYIQLFTTAHPLDQGVSLTFHQYLQSVLDRFSFYGREHAVAFVYGRAWDSMIYRAALLLVLVLAAAAGFWQWRKNRIAKVWTFGDTFFLLGCVWVFLLPVLPSKLNDCFYVADRLTIYAWLFFLISAGAIKLPMTDEGGWLAAQKAIARRVNIFVRVAVCLVLGTTVCFLHAADRLVRPIAVSVAEMSESQTGVTEHQIGFVMEDARAPLAGLHEGVSWNPYSWALVNAFRQQDAILANAPWMDESIIPVAPLAPLPEVSIGSLREPIPALLQYRFLNSPDDLRQTLQEVRFFFVNSYDRPAVRVEPLLQLRPAEANGWRCELHDWYRACFGPSLTTTDLQPKPEAQAKAVHPGLFYEAQPRSAGSRLLRVLPQ